VFSLEAFQYATRSGCRTLDSTGDRGITKQSKSYQSQASRQPGALSIRRHLASQGRTCLPCSSEVSLPRTSRVFAGAEPRMSGRCEAGPVVELQRWPISADRETGIVGGQHSSNVSEGPFLAKPHWTVRVMRPCRIVMRAEGRSHPSKDKLLSSSVFQIFIRAASERTVWFEATFGKHHDRANLFICSSAGERRALARELET
jgi:hypothetical protein